MSHSQWPSWVIDQKKKVESTLGALPIPGKKNENYRYIGTRDVSLPEKMIPFSPDPENENPEDLENLSGFGEGALLVVDSYQEEITLRSRVPNIPEKQGIFFGSWDQAFEQFPEKMQSHVNVPKNLKDDVFACAAVARWTHGAVLIIPEGVKLEYPLHLVHRFWEQNQNFTHRTLVLLGKGSEVTLIDELQSLGSPLNGKAPTTNGLIEVVAEESARLNWVQIQNWSGHVHSFLRESITAATHAKVEQTLVSVGGLKGQVRIEAECTGPGADIQVRGATHATGHQSFDYWFTGRHDCPSSSSSVDYWNVVEDQAKAIFNGNLVITKKGLGTNAYQKNRNLVLSKKATVHTIPKLEIATDEVTCAHGATVSPVDENQLYYLQTRGIPRDEAKKMVIDGFSAPVIQGLPIESLRNYVTLLMTGHLEKTVYG